MRTCSLDTNCLISFLLPGREAQAGKVQRLISTHECVVSDIAISEAVYVLLKGYELSRALVIENIRVILNMSDISCNRSIFRRVLRIYETHPALSFNDIYLSIQAEIGGNTPLYTFDRKLANQMVQAQLVE